MTQIVELDILNDTFWPWKAGCMLTLSEDQPSAEIPIELFNVPIEQEVKGKASTTV